MVHVSWFEADAFARAHGARLPTEVEWEKAATWDRRRRPPVPTRGEVELRCPALHGNLDQCGCGTAPAGAYPAGASPCGCLGMIGDVWEWTASQFDGYAGFVAHPYREYSEVFFGGALPRPARRLVGHTRSRGHADLPQLGLPRAPADLRRAADRAGR